MSSQTSRPEIGMPELGKDLNHNQTVVRPIPGIPGLAFNHNQTLVRK